jgi:transposase-like protein
MEPTSQGEVAKLNQVIQIDEGKIQAHLGEVVRSTVEETLNALLDAEADRLCRAERYERTEARCPRGLVPTNGSCIPRRVKSR